MAVCFTKVLQAGEIGLLCFLCLGVLIDVSAVTHLCRCVACFMPEIVLGLPIFFKVRSSAVIFRPAFPSLVLRCEEAGVENCLFSECDEFLVGFFVGTQSTQKQLRP